MWADLPLFATVTFDLDPCGLWPWPLRPLTRGKLANTSTLDKRTSQQGPNRIPRRTDRQMDRQTDRQKATHKSPGWAQKAVGSDSSSSEDSSTVEYSVCAVTTCKKHHILTIRYMYIMLQRVWFIFITPLFQVKCLFWWLTLILWTLLINDGKNIENLRLESSSVLDIVSLES